MSKNIKFNIQLTIDGKKQIVSAAMSVQELARNLNSARTNGDLLRNSLLKWNQIQQSFQNFNNGLQSLIGQMREYTAANTVQVEAETKLAANMRNTMGATEEEIAAIKQLTAEQQRLGVVGDEVQLAGAQELAIHLKKADTLKKLIPVMNDLIVKQDGVKASSATAASVASLLGKAMDGNTSALKRAGIMLTYHQKKVMENGTEDERAAVLIEALSAKVGGLNAELARTPAGQAQQAANAFGDWKEQIGSLIAPYESLMITVGQFGLAVNAITTMSTGVISSVRALTNWAFTAKVAALNSKMASNAVAWFTRVMNISSVSITVGTTAVKALTWAIRGLEIALGVGALLAALSLVFEAIGTSSKSAAEGMSEAEIESQRLADSQKEVTEAGVRAQAALEQQKAILKDLIEEKNAGKDVSKEEKKIVEELNNTYGDTMGYFAGVEAWYRALIANSDAYCKQMVIEAETRRLANQIAEKEEQRHNIVYDEQGNKKLYSTEHKTGQRQRKGGGGSSGNAMNALMGSGANSIEYYELPSEKDKAQNKYDSLTKEIGVLRGRLQDKVKEVGQIDFKVKGSPTRPGNPTAPTGNKSTGGHTNSSTGTNQNTEKHLIENAQTYKELSDNVAYYQQEIEKCKVTDTENIIALSKKKKAVEDLLQSFKDLTETSALPTDLKSLDDYDKKLQWLRKQRQEADKDAIAGIDAQIASLEKERQVLEDTGVAAMRDDEIKTYDDLNRKLAYYNGLLDKGDESQRKMAQKGINQLNKLKEAWDKVLEEQSLPTTTNTIGDIDKMISFYSSRQQTEDADQIEATQRLIDKLEAKKKSLSLGTELPGMQKEITEMEALGKREFKMKIRDYGFDELTAKIRDLQKLLADTENPVTDSQRKEIEGMIATYEQWRKQGVLSFGTMRQGWDGVKGIGDSVSSITSALESNGDAWQTVTGLIDGMLSIYDSVNGIITIIQMLTAVSQAHATAKTMEAGATIAAGTAETASAAGAETAAAAEVPLIVANKATAQSFMEMASAAYFAAHAAIPFAGYGIGAGFSAAATATVQAIGVTPFAEGGIVSGKTLGLIGEYAGASHNPEVVAPLDKLRGMLQTPQVMLPPGSIVGKLKGNDIVLVAANASRIRARSGHRSNIE